MVDKRAVGWQGGVARGIAAVAVCSVSKALSPPPFLTLLPLSLSLSLSLSSQTQNHGMCNFHSSNDSEFVLVCMCALSKRKQCPAK